MEDLKKITDAHAAMMRFKDAGNRLLELWNEDRDLFDTLFSQAYPRNLLSFDEQMAEIDSWSESVTKVCSQILNTESKWFLVDGALSTIADIVKENSEDITAMLELIQKLDSMFVGDSIGEGLNMANVKRIK